MKLAAIILLACSIMVHAEAKTPSERFNINVTTTERAYVRMVFNSVYGRAGRLAPAEPSCANQVYLIKWCRGTSLLAPAEWLAVLAIWNRRN